MSEAPSLHLILGDEELLVERAVGEVLRSVRERAGTDSGTYEVPVSRMRAGDVSTYELAELLSPSLFADERIVVLEAAAEAGRDAAGVIASAAADIPPGTLPSVANRLKMAKTSNVTAIVEAGGKLYSATKEVKVTVGGCGG